MTGTVHLATSEVIGKQLPLRGRNCTLEPVTILIDMDIDIVNAQNPRASQKPTKAEVDPPTI